MQQTLALVWLYPEPMKSRIAHKPVLVKSRWPLLCCSLPGVVATAICRSIALMIAGAGKPAGLRALAIHSVDLWRLPLTAMAAARLTMTSVD